MAQECSVCRDKRRKDIDRLLVSGTPLRDIAGRMVGVSKSSLARHKEHLPATLLKAQEAKEIARGDDLLGQLKDLQLKTLSILAKAGKDHRLALSAIAQARANIELLGRLLGDLKGEGATVNVLISPQWNDLRGRILAALGPYQEARLVVARALKEGESAIP